MTLPRILLAALCSLAAPFLTAATQVWSNLPIHGGGFVSGLVHHPTTPGLLYARTDVGGAFRWQPDLGEWLPLNDELGRPDAQLTGVLSLAVDPRDDQRLYLATGQYLEWWARNAAILRSNDRGLTWSRTELPIKLGGNSDGRSAGERLQVDPHLGSILFLGTNQDGLYRSADYGATWAKVAGFTSASVTSLVFDTATGAQGSPTPRLYAGTTSKAGDSLLVSNDGGTTWSAVAGQPANLHVYRLVVAGDGTLYGTWTNGLGPNGVTAGAVWKRSPSGTWTNITPPAGSGGFAGISLSAARPGLLLVTTLDRWSPHDEVYRSLDDGLSWTAVLGTGQTDHDEAPWASASTPHWIGDVQVDPANADDAWFVTGYGVFRSTNLQATSGASVRWSFRNRGLEETVPLDLVSPLNGAFLLSAIGDIDGFRHTSLTAAPASRLAPRAGTARSIDLAGTQDLVAARLSDTTGYYSQDQGVTWTAFATKPSYSSGVGRIGVNADGSVFLWAPEGSTPYRSTNRGGTWTAVTGLPAATGMAWAVATDRVNKDKAALFHRSSGSLYLSIDGGATWTRGATGLPQEEGDLEAVFGKEGHLWLAVANNGLYRSTNQGQSFTRVTTVSNAYHVSFGKGVSDTAYPSIFLDGTVGSATGIFRSDDEGATWTRLNDERKLFGNINDISGDPKTHGRVYLATGGRGIIVGQLTQVPAPVIVNHPVSATQPAGTAVQFFVTLSGDGPFSFQWYKDDEALSGATTATLTLASVSTNDEGRYTCLVTTEGGTVLSRPARLIVGTPVPGRISNLSVRTEMGSSPNPLIVGFVLYGGAKDILMRAVGPALAQLKQTGLVSDPKISLFDSSQANVAGNDNWGTNDIGAMRAVFNATGAFPIDDSNSKDAALLAHIGDLHTVHVGTGSGTASGMVLVEVYDAEQGTTRRLRNISARYFAGEGNKTLIAGFVIEGTEPKRVLIRAVASSLNTSLKANLTGLMENPKLTLMEYRQIKGSEAKQYFTIAENDDWESEAGAEAAFPIAGAFGLTKGSTDSALLVTLTEGIYSAVVNRTNGAFGEVLVEVYEVIP